MVLVLVTTLAGLLMPRVQLTLERHRARLELDRVADFLARAPLEAFLRGADYRLEAGPDGLVLSPDGPRLSLTAGWRWRIEGDGKGAVEGELRYWRNGVASGGTLRARLGKSDGAVREYRLEQKRGRGLVVEQSAAGEV